MENTTPLAGGTLDWWIVTLRESGDDEDSLYIVHIKAATKEEALERIKAALPQYTESKQWAEWNETFVIVNYFNPDALTLDNIEEDEDDEGDTNG